MQAAYKGKNPKPKGFAGATWPPRGVGHLKGPLGRLQGPKQGLQAGPRQGPKQSQAGPRQGPKQPEADLVAKGACPQKVSPDPGCRQAGPKQGPKQAPSRPQAGPKQAPSRAQAGPQAGQAGPKQGPKQAPSKLITRRLQKLPGGSPRAPMRVREGSQKGLSCQVSKLPRPSKLPESCRSPQPGELQQKLSKAFGKQAPLE